MTDADTQAAIDALAYRIRQRDAAIRDGAEDIEDADLFALEFFTRLRAQGWRPSPAKASSPPRHAPPLADKRSRDEELAAVRADMEAKAAAARAAREAPLEEGSAA